MNNRRNNFNKNPGKEQLFKIRLYRRRKICGRTTKGRQEFVGKEVQVRTEH